MNKTSTNGKGDKSRIGDYKKYGQRHDEIKWESKKVDKKGNPFYTKVYK